MKKHYYYCPKCQFTTVWDTERITHEEYTGHYMLIRTMDFSEVYFAKYKKV